MSDKLVARLEGTYGPLPAPLRETYLAVDRARFIRPCDRDLGPPPPAMQRWVRIERKAGAFRETEAPFPVTFIRSRSGG